MKIWNDYGSEHSSNLIMIGRFKNAGSAEKAKDILDKIEQQVSDDIKEGSIVVGDPPVRYTEGMMELMKSVGIHSIGPAEFEQFAYDVSVDLEGSEVHVRTDEVDISAFLKVLVDNGACVEVYSAHDYPEKNNAKEE